MDLKSYAEAYMAQHGEELEKIATTFVPTIELTRDELGKVIYFLMELKKFYRQKIMTKEARGLLDKMIEDLQGKTSQTKTTAVG